MKLPGSNTFTETFGTLSSKSFDIGDPGIILDILRTKIYKNPILAICREYCANARDAHREVGTPDRPIEVTLPNEWSNDLIIKDYGPGIDPSRMEDTFIRFGCSTKRQDNLQQGGFGLGCKTGFAYNDSFTVVTTVNGCRYTYTAFIDETKVGKMTLLKKEDVSEPNGTEIKITVSRGDYSAFSNGILEVGKHWPVRPSIIGKDIIWPLLDPVYTGTGWALPSKSSSFSVDRYGYRTVAGAAIVDGIEYIIDASSLDNASALHRSVLASGFFMYFGIGELSLAASREALHYDPDTQAKIIAKLDLVIQEVKNIITDRISKATSYAEACKEYIKVKEVLNKSGLMDAIKGITWNGNPLLAELKIKDVGEWAKLVTYEIDQSEDKIVSSRRVPNIEFLNDKIKILHQDTKMAHTPGYAIAFLLDQGYSKIQVIYTLDIPKSRDFELIVKRNKEKNIDPPVVTYDKSILNLLDIGSLQAVIDSVPKDKQTKTRISRPKKEEGHILGYKISAGSGINAVSTSFPADEGGLFIRVDYKEKRYYSGDREITTSDYLEMVSFLNLDVPPRGFTDVRVKKLSSVWVPLHEAFEKKLAIETAKHNIDSINEAAINSFYDYNWYLEDLKIESKIKNINDINSPLVKWIERSKFYREVLAQSRIIKSLLERYSNIVFEKCKGYKSELPTKSDCELRVLKEETELRYPLLEVIGNVNYNEVSKIIDYINLVDKDKLITNFNEAILMASQLSNDFSDLTNNENQPLQLTGT